MDNYLIYLVQSYNQEALKMLVDKYQKIMFSWVCQMIMASKLGKGIDLMLIKDDIDTLIYRTIETYDSSKGIFYSYLKGAVHNIVMNYVRYNHRNNAYEISLDQEIYEDIRLLDSIASCDNISLIEERYYAMEEVEDLLSKINKFKNKDKTIAYLKMQGYTSNEIAEMTKTSIRNVNYLVGKIKKM